MNNLVLTEIKNHVLYLTLNRPEKHNSLILPLLEEMITALQMAGENQEIRVVLLQANGRSFSSGGDAQAFLDHAANVEKYAHKIVGLLNQVILAMLDCPVPIVTSIHGLVTGGSMGFVLASDVVLVAPEAWFAPYYSTVGPSPDGGWAVLLPRLIGRQRAAHVLFTNHHISATEAVDWGLATAVVPAGEIHAVALQTAQKIADKKPGSVRHTKQLLNIDRTEIAKLLEIERDHFLDHIGTTEALDGFRHFLHDLRNRKELRA